MRRHNIPYKNTPLYSRLKKTIPWISYGFMYYFGKFSMTCMKEEHHDDTGSHPDPGPHSRCLGMV